ncbi:MAG: hypothetical protein PVF17_12095, partial [Ignavibacteria bacterium]
ANGEIATTKFIYNQDGQLDKASWFVKDSSRYSSNFYEHDAKGQLISAFREFSDGLTSFELFNFDSTGNKISEHFYRSDSTVGFASYLYENGRLKQAQFSNHKGWLNGTLVYNYNDRDLRENAKLMRGDNVICNIMYEYDNADNLSKEFWDFNGYWSQTFQYIYQKKNLIRNYYSSPLLQTSGKFRINKENYTFNNETGGPSIYYYDDNNLLVKKVFTRSDGITTTTFYEYDAERKLVSSNRGYSNGEIAKFTYKYDENNNLILRSFYRADTLYGFESYLYNADNELMKAYLLNIDNWLTGMITFNVNDLGIITGGEFKGEDGFDASISFNYNSEGHLSESIWKFTFGKFQKYNFEYEMIDSLL